MFGPLNVNICRIHPAADLSKRNKKILQILEVLQITVLPPTINHAFAQAGIHS
jgi:hypothetical protein